MNGYKLRDYQQASVDAVWQFLCTRQGNPVVVLPTGAGKSIVIAELARGAIENGLQALVLAHRKELLEQNAEKIRSLLPGVGVGIYSAGLKSRDTEAPVVLAGIQSVHGKAFDLGARPLVIIDEAHLVPDADSGMYRKFLSDLRVSCPAHRVVGLTATPYRLDSGLIYGRSQIFDDVAIDIQVGQLIEAGYLSPITSQPVVEVDTSGLHRRGGEFIRGEMEHLFDLHVRDACQETVAIADAMGRKKVIVFASGVSHAEHVAECIRHAGHDVGVVTGDTMPIVRAGILDDFRSGSLRFLVNVDVLTTGFDSPNIDCIAVMRATESAGLFAQIVGRGLRLSPGKAECVVLDFGGNLRRHGPIDAADYGKRSKPKGNGELGDAPSKECPACNEVVAAGLRECGCGFLFPPPEKVHDGSSDKDSPILQSQAKPQRWTVEAISYSEHDKKGAVGDTPKTLRVNYECVPDGDEEGNLRTQMISEWVCLSHEGFARRKAEQWWSARSMLPAPWNIAIAVDQCRRGALAETISITTVREGKFFRITDYVLGEKPDELLEEVDAFEDSEIPF